MSKRLLYHEREILRLYDERWSVHRIAEYVGMTSTAVTSFIAAHLQATVQQSVWYGGWMDWLAWNTIARRLHCCDAEQCKDAVVAAVPRSLRAIILDWLEEHEQTPLHHSHDPYGYKLRQWRIVRGVRQPKRLGDHSTNHDEDRAVDNPADPFLTWSIADHGLRWASFIGVKAEDAPSPIVKDPPVHRSGVTVNIGGGRTRAEMIQDGIDAERAERMARRAERDASRLASVRCAARLVTATTVPPPTCPRVGWNLCPDCSLPFCDTHLEDHSPCDD